MKKFVISSYMKNQKAAATRVLDQHLRKMIPNAAMMLRVPRDMKIEIAPIRSRGTLGVFNSNRNSIKIDSRKHHTFFDIIDTLMHEMIHAEQWHTGKLGWDSKLRMKLWNGEVWKKKGTTHNTYKTLPWEVEAFSRSKALAEQVLYTYQERTGISRARLDSFFQTEKS